ncbi:hypothetical protein B0H12DRAFT_1153329 [Mycena haematopus]|nr:hypothetical protein B0H12DRAFT_1153329 [Mycena haematopus]
MSPTFLRAHEFAIEGRLSARSVVQLSLDAWQIVGIVLAILLLIVLACGGVWWERRGRLAPEAGVPASEDKGTVGTNTTDDAPEQGLELEVRSPRKLQDIWVSALDVDESATGANGEAPTRPELSSTTSGNPGSAKLNSPNRLPDAE